MATASITFAYDATKAVVHVDSVPNGLGCACTCPCCGGRLIARHGKIMEHHFAHVTEDNCAGAYESSLHLAMKELIYRRKKIKVPSYKVDVSEISIIMNRMIYHSESTQDGFIEFDNIRKEDRLESIIPDLIGTIRNRELAIEVAVTHFVDSEKLRKIKEINISCLEIDLSKIVRDKNKKFSWEDLEAIVDELTYSGIWLHNIRHQELKKKALKALSDIKREEEIAFRRKRQQSISDWLFVKNKEEQRLRSKASQHYYYREILKFFGPNADRIKIINIENNENNALEVAPYIWQGFILKEYIINRKCQDLYLRDVERHVMRKFGFRECLNYEFSEAEEIRGAYFVVINYLEKLEKLGAVSIDRSTKNWAIYVCDDFNFKLAITE